MTGTGPDAVAAIVVAGGRSRRFGRDKLVEPVDGVPLVRHAIEAARRVAGTVVVVGPASDALGSDVVLVREDPPFSGPFAAVSAALDVLPDEAETVLVLAGDLLDPGPLPDLLLAALSSERANDDRPAPGAPVRSRAEAAVTVDEDGRRQPLLAAYRVAPLRAGVVGVDPYGRAAYALLDGLRVVEVPDPAEYARDVDTPTDLP